MSDDQDRKQSPFGDVSRRDFLKYCGSVATLLSVGCATGKKVTASDVAQTIEKAAAKPPVIWLEGQDCAGCSISFLNAEKPDIAAIVLDTISIRYHESIMAASGYKSEEAYQEALKGGGYVLVVEGSIPTADDRFCTVGGKNFKDMVLECSQGAAAIIAVGACATFGGIPRGTPSRGMPVSHFVKDKPVINLPHCPVHHEHLVETIVYYLQNKKAPDLDDKNRPLMFFSKTVHDQCPRRKHFDEGEMLTDWNDPKQKDWCLAEKGCKGPETYSDCVVRGYNGGVNHCIWCGSPCQGCSEPSFYAENSPLYAADVNALEILLAKRGEA